LLMNGSFDWVWAEAEAATAPITLMVPGLSAAPELIRRIAMWHPQLRLSLDHINLPPDNKLTMADRLTDILPLAVEIAGGFISEQYPRLTGKCPRNCHSLLLPTGKLLRIMMQTFFEAHPSQKIRGEFARIFYAVEFQWQNHVLHGR